MEKEGLGLGGFGPDAGGPKHCCNKERLKRQSDPFQPGRDGAAGKLNMVDRHVNVGGKNSDKQSDQTSPGQGQADDLGQEKTEAAQQFAHAAGDDAKEMKRDEGGHDGEEERGVGQMDRTGKEEK